MPSRENKSANFVGMSKRRLVGMEQMTGINQLKTLERVKRSDTIHYGQRIEINQMHQLQRAFVLDEILDALLDVSPIESGCILPTIGTAKIARRIIGGLLLR